MKLKRHYLVEISKEGREKAYRSISQNCTCASYEEIKELIVNGYNAVKIPGIIRREEMVEVVKDDQVAVGFSSPYRRNGNRLRVPAFVPFEEIRKIISPYDLLTYDFSARNKPMQALYVLKKFALTNNIKLGLWGSTGLEVFTGLSYTDENSDLDLLIEVNDYQGFEQVFAQLQHEVEDYNVKVDLEVDLPNGYGVKAAELILDTEYVLGKGIADVKLLKKSEIIASINDCVREDA